jgi:GMP synthase-like glutamine amidotransferase
MECHDEDLSPSQVEHQRKMQAEFDKVSFQISRMKQDALLEGKEVSQMVAMNHGVKYFTITSRQQVAAVVNGTPKRSAGEWFLLLVSVVG